jgi:hypothetical protein
MSESRRTDVIIQSITVIVVLVITLFVLYQLGAFTPVRKGPHQVRYRVEGTTTSAVITYVREDGKSTGLTTVGVPWEVTLTFTQATTVILTAGNPSQTGEIRCVIYLDGKLWKQQSARDPSDKVSCAGISP